MITCGAYPPAEGTKMPAWDTVKQVKAAVTVAADVPPGLTRTDESCVARGEVEAFGVK
jgi:hypothetical protein